MVPKGAVYANLFTKWVHHMKCFSMLVITNHSLPVLPEPAGEDGSHVVSYAGIVHYFFIQILRLSMLFDIHTMLNLFFLYLVRKHRCHHFFMGLHTLHTITQDQETTLWQAYNSTINKTVVDSLLFKMWWQESLNANSGLIAVWLHISKNIQIMWVTLCNTRIMLKDTFPVNIGWESLAHLGYRRTIVKC